MAPGVRRTGDTVEAEAVDEAAGRNSVRLVAHGSDVFVETWGNHDGVSVHTSVRMSRSRFRAIVVELGVMS